MKDVTGSMNLNSLKPQTYNHITGKGIISGGISDLTSGKQLTGEITGLTGNAVKIRLADGRMIFANLESASMLSIGDSASFIIKSNSGNGINLKLISTPSDSGNEAILLKALDAAGLPPTEKNIEAVRVLLDNHMSIDSSGIRRLLNQAAMHKELSLNTLALMNKSGIPVNNFTAAQMAGYEQPENQFLSHALEILDSIDSFLNENSSSSGANTEFLLKLTDIISSLSESTAYTGKSAGGTVKIPATASDVPSEAASAPVKAADITSDIPLPAAADITDNRTLMPSMPGQAQELQAPDNTLGGFLEPDEADELNLLLKEAFPAHFSKESDTPLMRFTPESLISRLKPLLQNAEIPDTGRLFESPVFRKLIRGALKNMLTLHPDEMTDKSRLREFYSEASALLDGLRELASGFKADAITSGLNRAASGLEFMCELNNVFPYIQLPLQLSSGNTQGELYVYRKKSRPRDPDEGVSVLLHLNMTNLGTTDIRIRLKNNSLHMNFYAESPEASSALSADIESLKKLLTKRGFDTDIVFTVRELPTGRIESVLSSDSPAETVSRYNFDIRA